MLAPTITFLLKISDTNTFMRTVVAFLIITDSSFASICQKIATNFISLPATYTMPHTSANFCFVNMQMQTHYFPVSLVQLVSRPQDLWSVSQLCHYTNGSKLPLFFPVFGTVAVSFGHGCSLGTQKSSSCSSTADQCQRERVGSGIVTSSYHGLCRVVLQSLDTEHALVLLFLIYNP